mmetsp:Transcript_42928/g.84657  ORF Transcript_42928/g.84657 Transcript_42928/m.84657 type:complete len:98 (-) Transcript_42928:3-296(-)
MRKGKEKKALKSTGRVCPAGTHPQVTTKAHPPQSTRMKAATTASLPMRQLMERTKEGRKGRRKDTGLPPKGSSRGAQKAKKKKEQREEGKRHSPTSH